MFGAAELELREADNVAERLEEAFDDCYRGRSMTRVAVVRDVRDVLRATRGGAVSGD